MLKSLLRVLNRDLTGRTWQREVAHPYFTSLVYFGNRDVWRSYWEAEVPSSNGTTFIAFLKSPPDGPSSAEEQFCRDAAAQLAMSSSFNAPLLYRAPLDAQSAVLWSGLNRSRCRRMATDGPILGTPHSRSAGNRS